MIFYIFVLAFSLSLDAFGVGMVYGLRKIKIPLASKLTICFFSIVYSGAALIVGKSLSGILSLHTSKLIGILILAVMGIWIIIQNIMRNETDEVLGCDYNTENKTLFELAIKSLGITILVTKNPIKIDIDKSGTIDIKESLLLGLALSVDAIGVGIGSALAGIVSILIPFSVGLFQLLFLYSGISLGKRFALSGKTNKKLLSLLPGLLLIFLAFIRIYQ